MVMYFCKAISAYGYKGNLFLSKCNLTDNFLK